MRNLVPRNSHSYTYVYAYTYVLEILNSITGTLIEELENNIMNIPAELVMVANQCDLHGLREEADVLTNIAKLLMAQDSGNAPIEQPTQPLDPAQIPPQQREMKIEEPGFQTPMDKALGREN